MEPPPQRWSAQEQPRFPLQMNLPLPWPCSASSLPHGPGRSVFSPLHTALSRGLCHPSPVSSLLPTTVCLLPAEWPLPPHLESTANIPTSATSCSRSTHLSLFLLPQIPCPVVPISTARSAPKSFCSSYSQVKSMPLALLLQGDLVLCDFEQGRWPLIPQSLCGSRSK